MSKKDLRDIRINIGLDKFTYDALFKYAKAIDTNVSTTAYYLLNQSAESLLSLADEINEIKARLEGGAHPTQDQVDMFGANALGITFKKLINEAAKEGVRTPKK